VKRCIKEELIERFSEQFRLQQDTGVLLGRKLVIFVGEVATQVQ
jgi:hypothetical protein